MALLVGTWRQRISIATVLATGLRTDRIGAARDPCRWLMPGLRTGNREVLRHLGLCAGRCQGGMVAHT